MSATASGTPYLALHARLQGFTPSLLDRHLYETRDLVKVHGFRGAFFLMRRKILAAVLCASTPGREAICRAYRRHHGVSDDSWRALRGRVLEVLGDRAMTAREISAAMKVGTLPPTFVRMLSVEGSLIQWTPVRAPGWESATHRWASRTAFFPEVDPKVLALEDAQSELLHRYLEAYGPASEKDAAWWLDANTRTVDRLLTGFDRVQWVVDDDTGQELVGLPARLPMATKPVPPAFVPGADHVPRAFRERAFFLDPEWSEQVVTRDGNVRATVWVDGKIRGRWAFAHGDGDGYVVVWMFEPFLSHTRKELALRARHIGGLPGYRRVSTLFAELPPGWPASKRPSLPPEIASRATARPGAKTPASRLGRSR